MESWRTVWRNGFQPILSNTHLVALLDLLERDDSRLIQGATSKPPPLICVVDWPVEAACLIGCCGWQGDGLEMVGEVETFFATKCYEADQKLGQPAACRHLLNWYDDAPRDMMRRELIGEVKECLAQRAASN